MTAQPFSVGAIFSRWVESSLAAGASDLFVFPAGQTVLVQRRVGGLLQEVCPALPAISFLSELAAHVRSLAGLDLLRTQLPQDGRISWSSSGGRDQVALRVSILPAHGGPSLALRLLDPSRRPPVLESLGFPEEVSRALREVALFPQGGLLVGGPTGGGKTTTLYALLGAWDAVGCKIVTVEDPVEYRLPGLLQVPVGGGSGLGFGGALRSVLRQDPDCILLGEIRDRETAELALQASLTGHRLLASIHAGSVDGVCLRLQQLGLHLPLAVEALDGLLVQRLSPVPGREDGSMRPSGQWLRIGEWNRGRLVVGGQAWVEEAQVFPFPHPAANSEVSH